jgi:outer membrane biogenesis lipoprotein LolB
MRLKLIALIVAALLIGGCVGAASTDQTAKKTTQMWAEHIPGAESTLTKVAIYSDNVTCYIMDGAYSGGIFCFEGIR